MKTTEQFFKDWESNTFGFGYGTGEEHTLVALKGFFAAIQKDENYDYREIERCVGSQVAWLLINILGHDDKIEYGVSPRFAWLTNSGKALKEFFDSHTIEELYEITELDNDYAYCYPDYCNCHAKDGEECRSKNPFFKP